MTDGRVEFDIETVIDRHVRREALDQYYLELKKQNETVNLVSRETSRIDFDRLCAEALLPLEVLPDRITNYLDIGSGGGFPAIPLVLSGRISGKALLVERTIKKAAALEKICTALGISSQVLPRTFEELSPHEKFELITLRYVKLEKPLLKKIKSLLSRDGRFVYYSSYEKAPRELDMLSFAFADPSSAVEKHFTVFRTK